MGVDLVWVYLNRATKARLCFLGLAALLINQSEVVMSRSVGGVQRCGFQVLLELFARALRAYHVAEKVSQQKNHQQQQKRRREQVKQIGYERERYKRTGSERNHSYRRAVLNLQHCAQRDSHQEDEVRKRHKPERGLDNSRVRAARAVSEECRYEHHQVGGGPGVKRAAHKLRVFLAKQYAEACAPRNQARCKKACGNENDYEKKQ